MLGVAKNSEKILLRLSGNFYARNFVEGQMPSCALVSVSHVPLAHHIYKVAKEKIYISMTSWWGQVRAGIIAAITDLQQRQVAGRSENSCTGSSEVGLQYLTLALTF
jgi:hypothetical protein